MAKAGFKVLDSDMHVYEDANLWKKYVEPEFRDRVPEGTTSQRGRRARLVYEGKLWASDAAFSAHTANILYVDQTRYFPYEDQNWSSQAQLQAMDVEGIDVGVLYPTLGLSALLKPGIDPKLAAAMARAYNNWLYDFCQADPNRLLGSALLSPWDVNDAVAEVRRAVKELGFKAAFLRPNFVNDRGWHEPYWEPLWDELERLDIPLGFHEGSGSLIRQAGDQFGANMMLRHTMSHPVEMMQSTVAFCGGGVLARHPNLRVAFLEGNCSWLPFLLWRLDEHWERLGKHDAPDLTMAPSEYFKRQAFASIEADEEPGKYVIDWMGSDRLVFSTDFPHSDSKFPTSVDRFLELPLSDEDKRKILWDNCAGYYGLKD